MNPLLCEVGFGVVCESRSECGVPDRDGDEPREDPRDPCSEDLIK